MITQLNRVPTSIKNVCDRITEPKQLSREEKDHLMFALMDQFGLELYRATDDDPSILLLTKE